jgi:beta-1,2-mannosidase
MERNSLSYTVRSRRRKPIAAGHLCAGVALCLFFSVAQAGSAQSWSIGPFQRASNGPVIQPDPSATFLDPVSGKQVHWEPEHTFNPAAVVKDGKMMVLYRAEDDSGQEMIGGHTSRLGLATSEDGIHFTMLPAPVFYPDKDAQQEREWPGGVEDPRIVETEDGMYVLTYTQWNRKIFTIGVATSTDLLHWQKHGPIFADAAGGKYQGFAYKSSGIVTKLENGKLVAAKLHGKYWMYWGEVEVRLATSTDLVHWDPVEESPGHPKVLLKARPGLFDSGFPEVGAPAVLGPDGIVVFYNGKNAKTGGDPKIGAGAYSAGEALFSADDPTQLIDRPDHPVLTPELPFEKTGQYVAGTVFGEALAFFQSRWWLYYGTADSFVGAASAPEKH